MARTSKTPPAKGGDNADAPDRIVLVVEATAAGASAWPASVADFIEPLLIAASTSRRNASASAMMIPSSRSPSPNRTGGIISSGSSTCPNHEFALVCYRAHAPFAPAAVTRR